MLSTRLVLVRHAHSDPHGALCGWTDIPLTRVGERQARALEELTLDVDATYASPSRRARDTARHLARDLAGEIQYDARLKEIYCGRFEGIELSAIQREHPALWEIHERQGDDDFRWPGGESYRELRARSVEILAWLAARHAGRRVAVVTHTGVITQVVGFLAGVPAGRWSAFRAGNASTTELDWAGDRGTVCSFDARDHLPSGLRT